MSKRNSKFTYIYAEYKVALNDWLQIESDED